MKKITILHPFTPQAAGVVEASVATYHSQPHAKAMEQLAINYEHNCRMQYFTPKWSGYRLKTHILNWEFFPVSFQWNGNHKKWKKQTSKSCFNEYLNQTPDVTIINMSGHSSPFSYELSKVILKNKKQYIAMLGGQHYTDEAWTREYFKNAHHILVHTHMQKKAMEAMELFKDMDIRVFPLGVDCTFFKPKEEANAKVVSPKLLYVGRIVEWKRIHLAIEGLNELVNNGFPESTLTIIGPTSSENYFTELQSLIKKYGLTKQVSFLGHKAHHELPAYFQDADLFLLPSDKETFGMVMIEAMACGIPVAAMDCPGGPADVIENQVDGLLSTPEKYAEDILKLVRNNSLLQTMKVKARQKVEEKYSINETYRVLENSINMAL